MRRVSVLLVYIITALPASLSSSGLNTYFNDAKSYGSTFNAGIVNKAKDGAHASSILPMYGTTSPEAALMGDGKTSVSAPSSTKITHCATSPADPDRYKRQECEAINFWQRNKTVRPQYTISRAHDPVVTRAKAIAGNPTAHTGNMPGLSGSYSGCTNRTIPGKAVTVDETCDEGYTLQGRTCERTREVEVKAEHDYECHVSNNKIERHSCDKVLTVNVTLTANCTHGTWIHAGYLRDSQYGNNQVEVSVYCDNYNQDTIYMRFTPIDYHGICSIGYGHVPKAQFTLSQSQAMNQWYESSCSYCDSEGGCWCTGYYVTYPTIAVAAVHWKGSCTVSFPIGLTAGTHGCSGNTCTYRFWGPEAGPLGELDSGMYTYGGPRWGWTFSGTVNSVKPGVIVNTTDVWDNRCSTLEARSR